MNPIENTWECVFAVSENWKTSSFCFLHSGYLGTQDSVCCDYQWYITFIYIYWYMVPPPLKKKNQLTLLWYAGDTSWDILSSYLVISRISPGKRPAPMSHEPDEIRFLKTSVRMTGNGETNTFWHQKKQPKNIDFWTLLEIVFSVFGSGMVIHIDI